VQIGWDAEFSRRIDPGCVYQALRTVAPSVERWTYVSDGGDKMPRNVQVTQFRYATTRPEGSFVVEFANLPSGRSVFHHQWRKIGTTISHQEEKVVEPVLKRANRAIAVRCNLPFRSDNPTKL
jgi:hypothetical protein